MITEGLKKLNTINNPRKKILFLGFDQNETLIIEELIKSNCEVWHTKAKIQSPFYKKYDFVISYGYRYLLRKDIIESLNVPIINLHISYLPWNRGAHPNFWSFYDKSVSGVTIHLIDEGVDTGPILFQKIIDFSESENTFRMTYERLNYEIEKLFLNNMEKIISKNYETYPQNGLGSFHLKKDLPISFRGWDTIIDKEIKRLKD